MPTEINNLDNSVEQKFDKLKSILNEMEKVLVAFSAGVDSTFLLKTAVDVLGEENVLAVTAASPIRFRDKVTKAEQIAGVLGVKHRVIETGELEEADFTGNGSLRCYYCKYELYQQLKEIAAKV